MAIDGIYLYSLVQDLKKSILNSKIDKINQPEKDEIIITLRKERKNLKLLISASPKYPRFNLTTVVKSNPLSFKVSNIKNASASLSTVITTTSK